MSGHRRSRADGQARGELRIWAGEGEVKAALRREARKIIPDGPVQVRRIIKFYGKRELLQC